MCEINNSNKRKMKYCIFFILKKTTQGQHFVMIIFVVVWILVPLCNHYTTKAMQNNVGDALRRHPFGINDIQHSIFPPALVMVKETPVASTLNGYLADVINIG